MTKGGGGERRLRLLPVHEGGREQQWRQGTMPCLPIPARSCVAETEMGRMSGRCFPVLLTLLRALPAGPCRRLPGQASERGV